MKILILSQYWHPENGVPQRRWTWLSKVLVDAGHEVTVIAPPPHYQRKITLKTWWGEGLYSAKAEKSNGPSGERIIRSGFFPAGQSLTQRALNQATVALGAMWVVLRRSDLLPTPTPDLVIGTVPALPTAVAARLVAKKLGKPYIIDLRDAWPDLLTESRNWNKSTGRKSMRERVLSKGPIQLIGAITKRSLNGALKHAAGISVTSSHLAENLKTRPEIMSDGRIPPVETIRNVFPPETKFTEGNENNGSRGHLNVLYAGTFGRAQNLENALCAAEIAREKGIDVALRFVGAGATREALSDYVQQRGLDVTIESRKSAGDLAPFYEWADTALVHLTNWEPLERAVPSKTYELMAARVHISAVVSGETAELVRVLGAGNVVAPETPEALADQWIRLANNRTLLEVKDEGPAWVDEERETVAPQRLLSLIEKARVPKR